MRRVVSKFPSMTFSSFMAILRARKRRINSIADLRSFWLESEEEDFPKIARILSNIFLRFYSLEYIFNSRISNYAGHVKYRGRLVEALQNPHNFTSIKQYWAIDPLTDIICCINIFKYICLLLQDLVEVETQRKQQTLRF